MISVAYRLAVSPGEVVPSALINFPLISAKTDGNENKRYHKQESWDSNGDGCSAVNMLGFTSLNKRDQHHEEDVVVTLSL